MSLDRVSLAQPYRSWQNLSGSAYAKQYDVHAAELPLLDSVELAHRCEPLAELFSNTRTMEVSFSSARLVQNDRMRSFSGKVAGCDVFESVIMRKDLLGQCYSAVIHVNHMWRRKRATVLPYARPLQRNKMWVRGFSTTSADGVHWQITFGRCFVAFAIEY